jgi:Helicase HerA, central domain
MIHPHTAPARPPAVSEGRRTIDPRQALRSRADAPDEHIYAQVSWPASSPTPRERGHASPTLGLDLETDEPVVLKDSHRRRHISVIGKTGYGKTTLLEHLILEDIHSNTSAVLIDPHGDLSQRIISLATQEERQRITLLEEWPDRPFRLNLLECAESTKIDRTVDDILTLFLRLFDGGAQQPGHRLRRYLGNALRTLIPNGRTLADTMRLFSDDDFRRAMLSGVQNRKVHEFWQLYDRLAPRERIEQLESTINRLDEFLSSETALAMVDSPTTTVPLTNVLTTDGQLLLVRIPIGELGELQARFYGSLFLSLLTDRLFARSEVPEASRHRLHLYLDEYGWFATSTTAALLQQARKYNLGATIAYQTLADLPDEKNRQAALQVGTTIILQLVGQNADALVSEFPVKPRGQSEEAITEDDGTKPIRGPSQEPVEHLLRAGHSNKTALTVAQGFLRPLIEASQKEEETARRTSWSRTFIQRPRADKRTAISLINQLLITAMELGPNLTPERIATGTADVFILIADFYGLPSRPLGPCITDERVPLASCAPGFRAALIEHLTEAVNAPDPSQYLTSASLSDLPWTILKDEQRRALSPETHYGGRSPEQVIDEACENLRTAAADLITLCRVLAADPILVSTGQEEAQVRTRYIIHPAQTHQDARLELAGMLANLKEYTAYYQTPESHGLVALTEPLASGQLYEDAIAQVRNRSKALYGRPDEQHSSSDRPLPTVPGTRIGRRPTTAKEHT